MDNNVNQTPENTSFTPPPAPEKESGVGIAALICGIVSVFFNPMYLPCLAAIICGIIGISNAKSRPKTMATIGSCLGVGALFLHVIVDFFLVPCGFCF